MADRLEIYRAALDHLGDAHGLSSLSEVGPAREALDRAWQPAVDYVLHKGLWNHAIRSVEISNDEDVEPLFGFDYAIQQPTDFIRLVGISDEATFFRGYDDYEDEAGRWYTNCDPLYVRYISSDDEYGWNVAAWKVPFTAAVEAYLAFKSGLPISSDKGSRNDMFSLFGKLLKEAKTLDAVDERVRVQPPGRLVTSRGGRMHRRGYR